MKRLTRYSGLFVLSCCFLATGALYANAAETEPAPEKRMEPAQAGRLDDATRDSNVRASVLLGMNVYNRAGNDIGNVNDLVLDADSGRVRYAALSYGGFLGLGDKLFAVPWRAFEFKRTIDSDEVRLVLPVSEEKIKNAEGFDQDHWPNFADREFTRRLELHYGAPYGAERDRRTDRPREDRRGGVDVRVGPGGVDVDVEGEHDHPDRRE